MIVNVAGPYMLTQAHDFIEIACHCVAAFSVLAA